MESAKQAGWGCLASGMLFIPLAVTFRWLGGVTEALPVIPGICAFCFWLCVAITAICVVYGVGGLIYGYSKCVRRLASHEGQRQDAESPIHISVQNNSTVKGK